MSIDLGPKVDEYRGDFARTYVIHDGKCMTNLEEIQKSDIDQEIKDAMQFIEHLHAHFQETIQPQMTFDKVYHMMNKYIQQHGYKNLDFHNNLGHSIEKSLENRILFQWHLLHQSCVQS